MSEITYNEILARPRISRPLGAIGRWYRRMPQRLAGASVVVLWVIIFFLSWVPQAMGQENVELTNDLMDMSLDELLNVEITSVSKKSERQREAAAAIYVLTKEDIRRSGATTIPELLRTVPGVSVAQIDANKWSVTARGTAGRFANKLLVLIDGRSVYTPFFSGVYWESKDVMLEDVERIEVIRGPGGTLWGANAVNGVINILTKRAADTQGGLLSVGGGTEEQGFASFRYGGRIGDRGHYRFYGKFFNRDEGGTNLDPGDIFGIGFSPSGGEADDGWLGGRGGFRIDLDLTDRDAFTIQGDAYRIEGSQTNDLAFFTPPVQRRIASDWLHTGHNVLARWTRTFSPTSDLQLQFYYDYYRTDDITIDEQRTTFDWDFQHRFQVGKQHEIVWGLGYRITMDDFENTVFTSLDPPERTDDIISGFIQDRIALSDTLRLTIGTKLEHNDFGGFEYQPSARIAWTPNDRHTLWGAVSRAVRTPSRADHDLRLVFAPISTSLLPNGFIISLGDDAFDSEELLAFELGYRVVVTEKLALDIAAFYNDYDNLRFSELGTIFTEITPPPPHDVAPLHFTNDAKAETFGIEIAADYTPRPWWAVHASYSFLENHVSNAQPGNALAGDVPEQQFVLRNRFDLPGNVEFDTILRYVDRLSDLGIGDYVTLDARLAWHPREDLEVAIVGQNLLDSEHFEFFELVHQPVSTGVERSIYGKITWRF